MMFRFLSLYVLLLSVDSQLQALCPDPVAPLNGGVTFTGNSVGDTATYTCHSGFELIGNVTTTCVQVDANSAAYSPAAPVCRPFPSTALFQLRLHRTGDCSIDNPVKKSQDIISTVTEVVEMRCSCGFTAANIQDSEFSCRSIEDTVVFRAEIVNAGSFTADELVEFISDWVQGEASISVDGIRLAVDNSCPTQLESFLSEDCVSPPGETLSTGAIVGGILGGVCVLLMITIIIVVILIRRRKLKSFSPTAEDIEFSQGTVRVEVNPAYKHCSSVPEALVSPYTPVSPSNEDEREHEYDTISFQRPSSTK